MDWYPVAELLVGPDFAETVFATEHRISPFMNQSLKKLLLDVMRILHEQLNIMNPFFHHPGQYGIQQAHSDLPFQFKMFTKIDSPNLFICRQILCASSL